MKKQWIVPALLVGGFVLLLGLKLFHRPLVEALTRDAAVRSVKASQEDRAKQAAEQAARGVAEGIRDKIIKDLESRRPATGPTTVPAEQSVRRLLAGRWSRPESPGDYARFSADGSFESRMTSASSVKANLQGSDATIDFSRRGTFAGTWSVSQGQLVTTVERASDLALAAPVKVTSPGYARKWGPEALEAVRAGVESGLIQPDRHKNSSITSEVVELTAGHLKLRRSDGGLETYVRSAE